MFLQENYGKKDPACVAKVKNLYRELDLEVCTLNDVSAIYLCGKRL
jgi:hypothetical protein